MNATVECSAICHGGNVEEKAYGIRSILSEVCHQPE